MTTAATRTRPPVLSAPSAEMLALADRVRAGGELVTGEFNNGRRKRMFAELDGRPVSVLTVRAVILRCMVREVSRTAGTVTWGPAE